MLRLPYILFETGKGSMWSAVVPIWTELESAFLVTMKMIAILAIPESGLVREGYMQTAVNAEMLALISELWDISWCNDEELWESV